MRTLPTKQNKLSQAPQPTVTSHHIKRPDTAMEIGTILRMTQVIKRDPSYTCLHVRTRSVDIYIIHNS